MAAITDSVLNKYCRLQADIYRKWNSKHMASEVAMKELDRLALLLDERRVFLLTFHARIGQQKMEEQKTIQEMI